MSVCVGEVYFLPDGASDMCGHRILPGQYRVLKVSKVTPISHDGSRHERSVVHIVGVDVEVPCPECGVALKTMSRCDECGTVLEGDLIERSVSEDQLLRVARRPTRWDFVGVD